MKRLDPARLGVLRAASQLFARPADVRAPGDVARHAGPVQAQEPRAARLAFRARSRRLAAADVDRARCEERSLLRAWMMRRTVHLIAAEDAGWLLPLFAGSLARQARKRMADFGLDRGAQDRALRLLLRSVETDGPLTRPWPSSPGVTCAPTGRGATVTSLAGPGCRWATAGSGCSESRTSCPRSGSATRHW